jgi:hypothetical protein
MLSFELAVDNDAIWLNNLFGLIIVDFARLENNGKWVSEVVV